MRTNDLKEQIELDVRLALDALRSAEEQVKVAKEGLELAENELAQARRRYDAGVAGGLEVTDAQTRLERARDNQTAALYQYNVARVDLAQAMGNVRERACSMKKRISILVVLIVAAAGAAVYAFRGTGATPTNRIVVSGNIELTEVNIAFKTAGRLIERRWTKATGEEGAGDRAARPRSACGAAGARGGGRAVVASRNWRRRRRRSNGSGRRWRRISSSARRTWRRARRGWRSCATARGRRRSRTPRRRWTRRRPRPDRARKDWERAQTLHKNDDISTAQFDQYRTRWRDRAEAALKSAQEREALVLAGPRAEQVGGAGGAGGAGARGA